MQIVKWGKKQRQVKVPVGWAFVRDGMEIKEKDKVFNRVTHSWDDCSDLAGMILGKDLESIVIRDQYHTLFWEEVEEDRNAVRISD